MNLPLYRYVMTLVSKDKSLLLEKRENCWRIPSYKMEFDDDYMPTQHMGKFTEISMQFFRRSKGLGSDIIRDERPLFVQCTQEISGDDIFWISEEEISVAEIKLGTNEEPDTAGILLALGFSLLRQPVEGRKEADKNLPSNTIYFRRDLNLLEWVDESGKFVAFYKPLTACYEQGVLVGFE